LNQPPSLASTNLSTPPKTLQVVLDHLKPERSRVSERVRSSVKPFAVHSRHHPCGKSTVSPLQGGKRYEDYKSVRCDM
jgi:hypothetical protein